MHDKETRAVQQDLWQEKLPDSNMAEIVEKLKQTIAKLSLPKLGD